MDKQNKTEIMKNIFIFVFMILYNLACIPFTRQEISAKDIFYFILCISMIFFIYKIKNNKKISYDILNIILPTILILFQPILNLSLMGIIIIAYIYMGLKNIRLKKVWLQIFLCSFFITILKYFVNIKNYKFNIFYGIIVSIIIAFICTVIYKILKEIRT